MGRVLNPPFDFSRHLCYRFLMSDVSVVDNKIQGRPRVFDQLSQDDVSKSIDNYFKKCVATERIPSIQGLALHLDISKSALKLYQRNEDYPILMTSLKKAVLRIEEDKMQRLYNRKYNPASAIFDLKANHGLSETTVVRHEGRIEHPIVVMPLKIDSDQVEDNALKTIDITPNKSESLPRGTDK